MKPPDDLKSQKTEALSRIAAELALIEVILGAFLHGLKIPFGGNLLSLNQGFFLIRSLRVAETPGENVRYPIYISTIVSLLKSLSPAGNKLGPMLSISMQGFLFSFGVLVLGAGTLGQMLGMALLSFWAFVQPVLTLLLFYGNDLITALQFYVDKLQKDTGISTDVFLYLFASVILIKLLLALSIPLIYRRLSPQQIENFVEAWANKARPQFQKLDLRPQSSHLQAMKMALRDLFRPFFLFSLLLMICFFWITEPSSAQFFWKCLRPLAVAFLFFYISRSPWIRSGTLRLKERGYFVELFEFFEKTQKNLKK